MTPELHAHIKHELSELAANRIRNTTFGICWHVCDEHARAEPLTWLLATAEEWPEFSGDRIYPVPSAIDSPEDAYLTRNLWIGEYGAARQRLVAFLLEELDALIDAQLGEPAKQPKFENVSCSQCGRDFGPGDHGFSHCENHRDLTPNAKVSGGGAFPPSA